MSRMAEVCEFCECDPCDCSWGYSTDDKIVIPNGGNCESNEEKVEDDDSRGSN